MFRPKNAKLTSAEDKAANLKKWDDVQKEKAELSNKRTVELKAQSEKIKTVPASALVTCDGATYGKWDELNKEDQDFCIEGADYSESKQSDGDSDYMLYQFVKMQPQRVIVSWTK